MNVLKLCDEHVTMVAFTAGWCGYCKAIKPELMKLAEMPQDKFHFFQIDTTDVANEQLFKDFGIKGFPTLLRFDPKTNTWQRYEGERTANALLQCSQTPQCGDGIWSTFPQPIVKTSHAQKVTTSNAILEMCSDHPSVLAFTGINWCSHCVDAQPALDALKAESAKTHLFHVQQFDWVLPPMTQSEENKRAEKIMQQFEIKSFPTFLVYDHIQKTFVRVNDIESLDKVLSNEETLQGLRTTTTKQQYWPHVPSYRELNCTSMSAQTPTMIMFIQEEEAEDMVLPTQEAEDMLHLDFCSACLTILIFSGQDWCVPCGNLESDMRLLQSRQGCGKKYHVKQFDYKLNQNDESKLMAESFKIERWPTYLIFNPVKNSFVHYLGPRKVNEMMRIDIRDMPMWNTPHNVTISLVRPLLATRTTRQTNSRLGLCAYCPTILVFALCGKTFIHLQEPDTNSKTHEIHVIQFTDANKDAMVFEFFGIQKFPTVLIYNPQLNLFFHYTRSMTNLQVIKTQYQQPGLQTWNVHPRVVVLK